MVFQRMPRNLRPSLCPACSACRWLIHRCRIQVFTDLVVLLVGASPVARTPFDVWSTAAEGQVISAHAFFKRLLARGEAESCDEVSYRSPHQLA